MKKDNITPSVSLVISVYNEERVLTRKIENTLELDYPDSLLEIAVISDGSTDGTNDIIQEYAQKGDRIRPFIVPTNKGKTACLNDFVPKLRGEVILFSDANSFYDKDLIRNIVRPFADERVGFVTGSTEYFTSTEDMAIEATSLYSKLERLTKSLESRIGSCVGADGAVFAIRKKLFYPMKPFDINDFVIPLMIIKRGYRGVLEESAVCREEAAPEMQSEFRRQTRITNRTLRALFNYKEFLNPFRDALFAFELFSHKLIKLVTPFLMIIIVLTNFIMALYNIFYAFMLGLQVFWYVLVYLGYRGEKTNNASRLTSLAYTFTLISLAMLKGWFTYLTGKTYSTWSPERTT